MLPLSKDNNVGMAENEAEVELSNIGESINATKSANSTQTSVPKLTAQELRQRQFSGPAVLKAGCPVPGSAIDIEQKRKAAHAANKFKPISFAGISDDEDEDDAAKVICNIPLQTTKRQHTSIAGENGVKRVKRIGNLVQRTTALKKMFEKHSTVFSILELPEEYTSSMVLDGVKASTLTENWLPEGILCKGCRSIETECVCPWTEAHVPMRQYVVATLVTLKAIVNEREFKGILALSRGNGPHTVLMVLQETTSMTSPSSIRRRRCHS